MEDKNPERPSFAPRNWGGWISVGFIWLMGRMPQRLGIALSVPLAWLILRLMKRRREVAERNIERCYPELSQQDRDSLVKDHFRSLARMLFETAWTWTSSDKRLQRWGQAENAEYANRITREGRGVLLITAHSTCLELGGWFGVKALDKPWAVYRPLRNPVIDWYSIRCRARYLDGTISKRVFRTMIRFLRDGGLLWYAPDQDFGPKLSIFAPFFGIEAATLGAIVLLVQKSGCAVVPMFPAYDEKTRRYVARFQPALENFPSGDAVADLARINAIMEKHIRQWPAQYWWVHRRFKTRPEGEPPFYD